MTISALEAERFLQDMRQGRKYSSQATYLMLLAFVRDLREAHGYQLIRRFALLSQNSYIPSAGSIYPALAHCQQQGWLRLRQEGRRKLYSLSEGGAAYLRQHQESSDYFLRTLDYRGRKMLWIRNAVSGQGTVQQAQEQTGWLPEFVLIRQSLKEALFEQADANHAQQAQIVAILERAVQEIRALKQEK